MWIDLEMTGLDVDTEVIIQAAMIITDAALNPLDQWVADIWQPDDKLAQMNPFVRRMHTKTGLLDRLKETTTDIGQAERAMMERVARYCPYPATLCGNTVWQDRKFIDKYMPGLGRYLHYRLLDISALKIISNRYFGPDAQFKKKSDGEHDALVDIKNSIDEFRHYRKTVLRAVPQPRNSGT